MAGSFIRKAFVVSVAAALAALCFASAAAADKERIHLTAAGKTAARAAVLQRADLGGATGWTGRATKPDLSSTPACPGFDPKQSDLVLIGAAETVWKHAGIEFDSEAQVLQTPKMVHLDWQRTVLAPPVATCLRAGLVKQLPASERLVSFKRLAFPRVATYTRAYRALLDVKTASSTVRVMADTAVFGRGRTELTLTTIAQLAAEPAVAAAEVRLARVLVSRAS
ncbi:MAG: hypothetical protein ACRDM1_08205 [Gaiellaceae bacterium]